MRPGGIPSGLFCALDRPVTNPLASPALHSGPVRFNIALVSLPRISARSLYLLALFQLVAGPLVLVTVMTFCKAVVYEAPAQGVVKAMKSAWHSDEVQSLVDVACDRQAHEGQAPVPSKKQTTEHGKFIAIAWDIVPQTFASSPEGISPHDWTSNWTPAWPQAPPGTPPRIA